jgi:glycosyltransferase involved in cell wall biosynthesis
MPTYNRAGTITYAIESILTQTFTDWELLIIDNESTDDTALIVKKYCEKDERIKYFNVPKSTLGGISEYLNFGIEKAAGKYIARLDDDDEWCNNEKLAKQTHFFDTYSDYVLTGSGAIMIDGNRKEIFRFFKRETDSEIRNNALMANPFWHNTVMFRKSAVDSVGGYGNFRFVEDWDLWLRMGKIGKFYNFKEHFSLYMNAGQNISVSNQKLAGKTILRLLKNYKDEYPNFYKAYCLNLMQLLFAYLPLFIRKRVQNFLFFIKRNYF